MNMKPEICSRLGRGVLQLVQVTALGLWASACLMANDDVPSDDEVGPVGFQESPITQDEESEFGGDPCNPFEDGEPNPDWPQCLPDDTPPQAGCSSYSSCYCFCRWVHQCNNDPSECDDLSQCLGICDDRYPGCPYPGDTYPDSPLDC